jgi:quinoprotein glucose dehydrogenase
MTSPPVIVRGVIVVGSSVMDWWARRPSPPGDVRGFDARTGRLLWTFNTVPQAGEPGVETWEKDSWKEAGNANVWAPMSADEELGYVYLPVSTPTNDYYGGHRPGNGLFGDSLVRIDAATGKKIWHYQLVRHGLWDYDTPAAPNLIDIAVDGRSIKAVAQVTKQAFVYVFDRVTGRPVWPIEDRPVPASGVPGESAAKTQPFPTRPAPIDFQGVREEDVIDLTPDLRKEALAIIAQYDHGSLYTPPPTWPGASSTSCSPWAEVLWSRSWLPLRFDGSARQPLLALDGKSRRCNNFGSYGWYKRRGERVDFMPEFDPFSPSSVTWPLRCSMRFRHACDKR